MVSIPDDARGRCPGLTIGLLRVKTSANRYLNTRLDEESSALESVLRERFGSTGKGDMAELPVMSEYVRYYRGFDKTYQLLLQLESVAAKGRPIPRITPLVQAMFMAEMKNFFLTAGHDTATLDGPLCLRFADGTERYTTLAGPEKTVQEGDLCIADRAGIVSCVIYGPDSRTRIGPETTEALYTVYAPFHADSGMILSHLNDIARFIRLNDKDAQTAEPELIR